MRRDKKGSAHGLSISSVYVHVPFCLSKCPYCDFYSVPYSPEKEKAYLDALLREIELRSSELEVSSLRTIYFGGGTPNILSMSTLETIVCELERRFGFESDYEASIEVNPELVSLEKAKALRLIGFNRASLGAQSFNDASLSFLGRSHDSKSVRKAFGYLREAGFENLNVDVLFGIPGEDLSSFVASLSQALELMPEHISLYCLTLKEDTPFWRQAVSGQLKEVAEEDCCDQYYSALEILEEHGFQQYEVSNFCREGMECLHNLFCWRGREYIGFGPSACSYYNRRRDKVKSELSEYIRALQNKRVVFDYVEHLSEEQVLIEKIYLGLRTREGFELKHLHAYLEMSDKRCGHRLADLLSVGMIEVCGSRIRVGRPYLMLTDALAGVILEN